MIGTVRVWADAAGVRRKRGPGPNGPANLKDSPLEETGFEPPVPLARIHVIFGEEKRPEVYQRGLERRRLFYGGDQRFESPSLQRRVINPSAGEEIETSRRTTSIPRRAVRSGSPRSPRVSSAGSIPRPASRI
jgi:hypothetical protein